MSKILDCLGMGIAPIDILFQIAKYPRPGAKIDALDMTVQGGGPIPTAMVTLARLGMKAGLIAVIGDDPMGGFIRNELRREKVDITYLIEQKGKRSAVAAGWFESGSGRRTIVLDRQISLRPADIALNKLPSARSVHIDGRDLPACLKLARWAKKHNIPVIFDIGSRRNDVTALLPLVDHLVVAAEFAFPFTGRRHILDCIRSLSRHCPGTIVITRGTDGSAGYSFRDGLVFQKAFKVATVDTTGAGDVYHGAYIFGLLQGWNLERRMRFASAAAALKCTRPGGRSGIARCRRVVSFLRQEPVTYA